MKRNALAASVAILIFMKDWTAATQTRPDARYRDVGLADVMKVPESFDQTLVRVRGLIQLEFEGNVLWLNSDARDAGRLQDAVWIEVGWPVAEALKPMAGTEVLVEARFDAKARGHMGCCRGTLTDIRAIWRPDLNGDGYLPNFETREDALEQLQFKTGWLFLAVLHGDKYWGARPAFLAISPSGAAVDPVRLPSPGETIELAGRSRIYILDYATSGEARRMESPLTRGRREQSSETRLFLPQGAKVRVAEIFESRPTGELRSAWARVVPAQDR